MTFHDICDAGKCKLCGKLTSHRLLLSTEKEYTNFRKVVGLDVVKMTDLVCANCIEKKAKEGTKG